MITTDNYQAFRIGDERIVRIHYSKDVFKDFNPMSCNIVRYDLNAEMKVDEIRATKSMLITENNILKEKLIEKDKKITKLEKQKQQILTDYKLSTFDELSVLYSEFKKSKSIDFEDWKRNLQRLETRKLEKARQENYKPSGVDDCYSEAIESSHPKAYDRWLTDRFDKVRTLRD